MVGIAQMVEHLVVVQDVAGSSPVTHPEGSAPDLSRRSGADPFFDSTQGRRRTPGAARPVRRRPVRPGRRRRPRSGCRRRACRVPPAQRRGGGGAPRTRPGRGRRHRTTRAGPPGPVSAGVPEGDQPLPAAGDDELVERRPHPTDRRARHLVLTAEGTGVRARLLELLAEGSPLAGLGPEGRRALQELLEKKAGRPTEPTNLDHAAGSKASAGRDGALESRRRTAVAAGPGAGPPRRSRGPPSRSSWTGPVRGHASLLLMSRRSRRAARPGAPTLRGPVAWSAAPRTGPPRRVPVVP